MDNKQRCKIGIWEVWPGGTLGIDVTEQEAYYFALQHYELSPRQEWIHAYTYAPAEIWGKKDRWEFITPPIKRLFEHHEAVALLAARKDGQALSETEQIRLRQACKCHHNFPVASENELRLREVSLQIEKICQSGDTVLAVMTDTHHTIGGNWHSLLNCLQVLKGKLDGLVHLGDFTDGMLSKGETDFQLNAMLTDIESLHIPFFAVLGNHDANYFHNNAAVLSLTEQVCLYQKLTEPYKREPLQPYYSFDLQAKVRCFVLSAFAVTEQNRYGFDDEQITWLQQEIIKVPANINIIIFSHIAPLLQLDVWAKEIRNGDRLVELLEVQQARCGNILAYIHGHTHGDYIYRERSFPIVSIGCAKCEDMLVHKPRGFTTPRREWGKYTENLFDVLVISPSRRDIDFIRVGAGNNRRLSVNLNKEESRKMKKVITYGSFDLFHEGHYRLLERAKALGDYLIVGVTSEHFDENRGKLNIVDSLMERIHNVEKTGFADEIIIEDHVGQKVEDIQKYHVDIFTLGSDWTGKFDYLQEYCQVVYLERTKGISSTMKREAAYKLLRFGVIGSGRIAGRFVDESFFVSGVNVEGVYNPHIESANLFKRQHELAFATDSLEEFLGKVNAVYIASPHGTHYVYAKEALRHGLHVLCEKPLCLKKAEAEELFALAKEKALVFMEAIKTAYSPGFVRLISMAKSGAIGKVVDVEGCFTRITPSNLRELTDTEYGGSFTEMGSYTLLPIIKLLGTKYESLRFESFFTDNGLDSYTKVYIKYANAIATSKTGLKVKSDGQLLISGTSGYIKVTPPWWKTTEFEVCYEDFTQNEKFFTKYQGVGLRYELSDFVSTVNGYGTGSYKLTPEESIAMAGIMEEYLKWRNEHR